VDVCPTKADMRGRVAIWRREGCRVGLVPTMGYLHEGHLALVRRARALADRVAVSIFVNPTQFGPNEDLTSYPRDLDRDLALLRAEGVDAVFVPTPDEMYHPDRQTSVEVGGLSDVLMGALRPGHFRGVATVVTKLFNIVTPDVAVFGEKDYQQLLIIRTMARDLDMDLRIEGVPTLREADGLAMSSRNVRLTPGDRAAAPILHAALSEAEGLAATLDAASLADRLRARIAAEPRAQVQSVDIRDADTLAPLEGPLNRPAVILLAVRFGQVLLIDQRVVARGETP
jgi:pantoate--beta-alanine ligase